ncbi:MAG TPA: helix-hairpin-helix domain-containing protein, partial [Thermoplasmata archaeon]|nr:helix-hairpin-helix domain-containing protein [Thermoplasmata archaeon]
MRNGEVAALLYEIADLLEMSEEDRFRPISYRRAARSIEALAEDIEDIARQRRLREIAGVGDAISEKIQKYLKEGKLDYLEELRKRFPPGLAEIMRIPGVGPKTARQLFFESKITNLDELRAAAEQGRLRTLKGFKEKTEENILKGIKMLQAGAGKILSGVALPLAEKIVAYLRA